MEPHWEHFVHEADIGVRGLAGTREQAFAQAALAMMAVITDPGLIQAKQEVSIACEAADDELLLVDWLDALVFEMATRKLLFSEFLVQINGHCLQALCRGEPIDPRRHQPAVEIKGATFTELSVREENGRWLAQTVVDV